jgi:hypothetical protein
MHTSMIENFRGQCFYNKGQRKSIDLIELPRYSQKSHEAIQQTFPKF